MLSLQCWGWFDRPPGIPCPVQGSAPLDRDDAPGFELAMHITILALGSRGDIQPYAALGQGLRARGHQIRFITFESFASLIAEHGLELHPIHGDARGLVAGAGADMRALIRSFGSLAEGYAHDLSAPHLGETDLIINQLPAGLYGYDLAEKFGVPMALAAVMPLARTRAFPLVNFPHLPLPGYNKATYILGEQIAWGMFRTVINRWRKHVLRLEPLPLRGYMAHLGTSRIPILNGFSQHVVQRPLDWGEHIHITGYWFPEQPRWQPPADLAAFLDTGSPPVFIGFGSMPIKNPARTTQIVVEALRQSGQRGVIQAGWGGLGAQALPESVFKMDYAPYGWLFPRMGMVIHHGGAGTTAFGLRAGVPSCAIPFVFDQKYWGERIAALGVGPAPICFKGLRVALLAEAIQLGINNSEMHQRSAVLGRKIQLEDGIGKAMQIIESLQVPGSRDNHGCQGMGEQI